jgi:hypothetical protein
MQRRTLRGAMVVQSLALLGLLFLVPRISESIAEVAKAAQRELAGTSTPFVERSRPQSGEEFGLPKFSREVVRMLRLLGLKDYSLSSWLRKELRTNQRIIEGAWPIPYNDDSPNLFLRKTDRLPPRCEIRRAGRDIDYAFCS